VNQGFCLNTESTSFKAVVRSFVGESGEGTNRAGGKRQQSFHFLTFCDLEENQDLNQWREVF
jgi:hypothetical protein